VKQILLILTAFTLTCTLPAQDVPIGQWKEHLSYRSALSVAEGNGKVYCATRSGVFIFNKSDNSMERLSKVNGLSDVDANVLNFNTYNNTLLIAYKNANIDLVQNNVVINIADIKRKSIIGNKSINNIYFINQYAYLSCGFGIVIIDMDKLEVKDTYYIGPNGNLINVRDFTSDGTYFYAATDGGIYRALQNNPNLANYNAWIKLNGPGTGLPNGIYNTVTVFNGKIFTNFSKFLATNIPNEDSIYTYNGTSWNKFLPTSGYTVTSLRGYAGIFLLAQDGGISTFDVNLNGVGFYASYFSDIARSKQAVIDNSNNLWIADSKYGLVSFLTGVGYEYRYPNGPSSSNTSAMDLKDNKLWVAPGGVNGGWGNVYFVDGLYKYSDGQWSNTKGNYPTVVNLDTMYDFLNIYVDPNNSKRVYAATWGRGLVELYNDVPVKHYNETNSSLQTLNIPGYTPIWTYGLAMDQNQNLWVTNPGVPLSVSVKKANGSWQALDFSPFVGSMPYLGQILIDKNDQKWIIVTRGGGIVVYKGGTTAAPNSSNAKKLSIETGKGALPSTGVYCLAEDMDGEIWVGTDKGIAVFYSPENVFTGQNFDSQQILLEQDGHVQILLETELVQAIAVDGANRKWIATANSGVFLMSADGTSQIAHFDESNSPLFSNDVKSVVINDKTGEVYFGTSKGIISYRGTATEAFEDFTDVYAFPNPVKHNYDGPIAIKGLIDNTTLKITDISGTLVYETKSEGGQAIWYGKNFKDERVSTGVYMVFCTSPDGAKKAITKILVIN
jgi:hypothetical protein